MCVDDEVRLKGFKMGNVHRNERRGLRERVFESVVGDLTQAIAYRKMGCVDDLTFVERLTNAMRSAWRNWFAGKSGHTLIPSKFP